MPACGIEFSVEEFRLVEVVIFWSARQETRYQCYVSLHILVFIIFRQAGGIFRMAIVIGLCNFSFLDIHLNESERTMKPGIDTIDGNLRNGLVLCHRLTVEGGDVDDIAIGI